jgi:dCMP deaminase
MRYNGFICDAPHISQIHDDHEQSIIHNEINANTDCAKRRRVLSNSKYITHYQCINCFRSIAASNIKEFVYNDPIVNLLAQDAGIEIRHLHDI